MRKSFIGLLTCKATIALIILAGICCMATSSLEASPYQDNNRYIQPIGPGIELSPQIAYIDQWACTAQYREAADNKELLRQLIGGHLITVGQMLSSIDIETQRQGIGIALQAAMCASERLGDNPLAIEICDKYLLPNMTVTEQESWKYLSTEAVAMKIIVIWEAAGETQKVIDGYKGLLAWLPDGNTADAMRVKLAEVLDKQGEYEEAIYYLSQIGDDSSMAGAKDMIEELEEKLAGN